MHDKNGGCAHISNGYRVALTTPQYSTTGYTLQELMQREQASTFLVRQESYTEDVAALFDWLCLPREAIPPEPRTHDDAFKRKEDTALSDEGQRAITEALNDEYYWLEFLEMIAVNGNKVSDRHRRSQSQESS